MKRLILSLGLLAVAWTAKAESYELTSPDGQLTATVKDQGGKLTYEVNYGGTAVLRPSLLGLKTNVADFTHAMRLTSGHEERDCTFSYEMKNVKKSKITGTYNSYIFTAENADGQRLEVEFHMADNDMAFRYRLPRPEGDNPKCCNVLQEVTSFFPADGTTTFLCPQIGPMTGWERTKPSYEEEYVADAPMDTPSQFGEGYTFPCLMKTSQGAQTRWLLISETGVGSNYCAAHLSDFDPQTGYTIAYPMEGEANGFGSTFAAIALPGLTPWRTLTVGSSLKPIVETTIAYDVVEPLYEPTRQYKPGRYTWSWLIGQDESINYQDQVRFIDLAAEMGFEYCLVDNWWDRQIGREAMARLSQYAQERDVKLLLWYNSNGFANDAPQTPRDCMATAIARQREMTWLKEIGAAGIKVDFFGSDKQETMRLYEDILADANRFGLQVVFHGCTIPRGWERMYPNYVASEAALASENVFFSEHHARQEGFQLTMHPFSRNALGSFDWGGIIMNRHLSTDNQSRHPRHTSDIFELATGIVLQTSVNCVAMQPNNIADTPLFEQDFLTRMPTTWDDTRFVDGYPTRYVVLARRHGDDWYVAGLNGTQQTMSLTLSLPMFAGQTVSYYTDLPKKRGAVVPEPTLKTLKVDKKGRAKVIMQPMGGLILMKPIEDPKE